MNCAVALWATAYWLWQLSNNYDWALFWVRILTIGSTLIPIFYLHWVLSFLKRSQRRLIIFGYVLTGIFLLFSFSQLVVKSVEPKLFFPFWPNPGILYGFYLVFSYLLFVGYGVYLLFKAFRESSGDERAQIKYILFGTIVGFIGGATNFFLWYGVKIPPLGNPFVMLYPALLTYAVFKHHLMNIRVISTELFAGLMTVVFLFNVLLSKSLHQFLISAPLLVLVTVFGIFLVRGTLREIKVLENLTTKLEEANETLKKLDEAKSEFISIASHQLRTPISIIKGFSSMLQEGNYGALPEKAKEVVGKIGTSTERLNRLINDLLDLSRMEGGKMQFNWESISLTDLIASVAEELKPVADQNQLELRWRPPQDKLYVRADQEKLRQVILNLIDNAIKYTLKGYVEIKLEKTKAGSARLSVKDTGIGMDKEELALIFGKFVRGKKVPRLWTEGVGLGLYIAKKIIEEHKGNVWAESEGKGKGSAFFVEIPVY